MTVSLVPSFGLFYLETDDLRFLFYFFSLIMVTPFDEVFFSRLVSLLYVRNGRRTYEYDKCMT